MSWERWAEAERNELEVQARLRTVRDLDSRGVRGTLLPDGERVIAFASNDYLGLTHHPRVLEAGQEAFERWGAGSGASRLVTGSRPVHSLLESALADWKSTPSALLFSSGYAANVGVLTALTSPSTLICSDELNHASIVDGCRLARARKLVYPHLDVSSLDDALGRAPRAIVVSDTVFSMDGDRAPLDELAEVCRRHDALLVLDEAHAVFGPHPALEGVAHLRVGTLSKTLGSAGGFVAGSPALIQVLVNRARSFVFSTALPPPTVAAAHAALEVLRSPEGDALVARLRGHVDRLRPDHPSPIVSLVVGDDRAALLASRRLLDEGVFVPAIRPPSVPEGTARLRVTLSAAHSDEDVDLLLGVLARLVPSTSRA